MCHLKLAPGVAPAAPAPRSVHIDSPGPESGVSNQKVLTRAEGEQQLFQMLVHGFRHLKHIQLLGAEDWLQFFIGDDLALIRGVL